MHGDRVERVADGGIPAAALRRDLAREGREFRLAERDQLRRQAVARSRAVGRELGRDSRGVSSGNGRLLRSLRGHAGREHGHEQAAGQGTGRESESGGHHALPPIVHGARIG